jgi:hypothetical protein
LLTLAGPILPNAEVVADLPAAPKDIRVAGYLLHCDKPSCLPDVISSHFLSANDNSDGSSHGFTIFSKE